MWFWSVCADDPLPTNTRIWIAAGVTDMRRGFTGLSAVVQTTLEARSALRSCLRLPRSARRSDQGVVVRWRWTLSVCQAPGAWTLCVAEGRQRHGVADAGAAVDALRRHRLATADPHGRFIDGYLISTCDLHSYLCGCGRIAAEFMAYSAHGCHAHNAAGSEHAGCRCVAGDAAIMSVHCSTSS